MAHFDNQRHHRLLAVAVGAFVVVPTVGSFVPLPNVHAEPNNGGEWDIQWYDGCIDNWVLGNPDYVKAGDPIPEGVYHNCCTISGGIWNYGAHKCEAPPATGASSGQRTPPTRTANLPPGATQLNPQ
ncbi:hypothetical protein ACNO8X_21130 [Mycobacterium sp. PDNC021]|uniref:hypothetical protein n=1 Tax=Mycobacterium sp. PDNC021 TaxID=3391399 RepID=UPI003AAE2DD4